MRQEAGKEEHDRRVPGLDEITARLLSYCETNDWAGYDPYDALNSRLLAHTPLFSSRIGRILCTQILKRLPINLRETLLIPKERNPKAIALFLKALLRLSASGRLNCKDVSVHMVEALQELRSANLDYSCWGYSFPWQTRDKLVPRGAPNLVCTCFVADALLDHYEANPRAEHAAAMAVSSGEYLLDELYWTGTDEVAGFGYPLPATRTQVHNANLLGAALLCRVYSVTGEKKFLEPALKVARTSAAGQNADGSWYYGEANSQRWIDNFHTGYNLCALRRIGRYSNTGEFEPHVARGFEFYRSRFFREDGAPRYFHNSTYPIDIHSVAQSVLTLLELKDLDAANLDAAGSVLDWARRNMWDDQGYFYYQVFPHWKIRIPYMRWSQAWMLLALSTSMQELTTCSAGDSRAKSDREHQIQRGPNVSQTKDLCLHLHV